jgi:hypothetical protein
MRERPSPGYRKRRSGNGLRNSSTRARLIGGSLHVVGFGGLDPSRNRPGRIKRLIKEGARTREEREPRSRDGSRDMAPIRSWAAACRGHAWDRARSLGGRRLHGWRPACWARRGWSRTVDRQRYLRWTEKVCQAGDRGEVARDDPHGAGGLEERLAPLEDREELAGEACSGLRPHGGPRALRPGGERGGGDPRRRGTRSRRARGAARSLHSRQMPM